MSDYLRKLFCLFVFSFINSGCYQGSHTPNDYFETEELDRSDSILGVDVNRDHIRDDVETYIRKSYKDSLMRGVVSRYASALQSTMLVNTKNIHQLRSVFLKYESAKYCLDVALREASDRELNDMLPIASMTINTGARFYAYVQYENSIEQHRFKTPASFNCHD